MNNNKTGLLRSATSPNGLTGYTPLELLKASGAEALQRESARLGGGMISDPNYGPPQSFVLGNLPMNIPQPNQQDMQIGAEQVMNMMPGAGIFVGVGAKSANKTMLKKAKSMASHGAGRKEIWNKTGWFKDVDSQWKYEINDREASFNKLRKSEDELLYRNENVGQAYDHPEAVGSYVGLENIKIRQSVPPNSGAYSKDGNYIDIGVSANPKDTALHELQHAIQAKANFGRGGSTDNVWSSGQYKDELAKEMAIQLEPMSLKDFIARESHGRPSPDLDDIRQKYQDYLERLSLWKAHNDPLDYLNSPAQNKAGYNIYKRLGGEVESRNVERRMDLTPEQRMVSPPWETIDVKEDQIINRFYPE